MGFESQEWNVTIWSDVWVLESLWKYSPGFVYEGASKQGWAAVGTPTLNVGNQSRGCGSELNQNRESKLSVSTWLSLPDYTVWAAASRSSGHYQSPTMTASAFKLWAQCHNRRPINTHVNIFHQQSRFCFVLFCFVFFWSQILEVDQEGNIGARIWKAFTEYLQSSKLSRGLEDTKNTVPNISK